MPADDACEPRSHSGQESSDRAKRIADKYIDRDGGEAKIDSAAEYGRLAELPLDEYDRQREAVADRHRIRVSTLGKLVNRRREGSTAGQDTEIGVAEVEPWPDPVDGAQLPDEIAQAIRDHIILRTQQADMRKRRDGLMAFLERAIALGEPIGCSV
jgi:hypothetical protein